MTWPRTIRRAFTFVEVLVAMALATLLMVGVLEVLKITARHQQWLTEKANSEAWHAQLQRQLRWDMVLARQFELSRDQLRLVGYMGRDALTDRPVYRPTEIVYGLHPIGQTYWLVRREKRLDDTTNQDSSREIVCSGIGSMRMELGQDHADSIVTTGTLPASCRLQMLDLEGRSVVDVFLVE